MHFDRYLRLFSALLCVGFAARAQAGFRGDSGGVSSSAQAIVGGELADEDWPFMAAIYRGSAQYCGGSKVADGWTLTAAHCVLNGNDRVSAPSRFSVEVGARTLRQRPREVARSVCVYPFFDADALDHDVALLQHRVSSTAATPSVPLAVDGSWIEARRPVQVAGWGRTQEETVDSELRATTVETVPQEVCGRIYGARVTDNMWCASTPPGARFTDACQGDSGGPIIARDPRGEAVQVGIVSWGTGCAQPQYPGVYTRADRYRAWVDACVSGDETLCNTCSGCWDVDGDDRCDPAEDVNGDNTCSVDDCVARQREVVFSIVASSKAPDDGFCAEPTAIARAGRDINGDDILQPNEVNDALEWCQASGTSRPFAAGRSVARGAYPVKLGVFPARIADGCRAGGSVVFAGADADRNDRLERSEGYTGVSFCKLNSESGCAATGGGNGWAVLLVLCAWRFWAACRLRVQTLFTT